MKSTDLSREQSDNLLANVAPMLGYLMRPSDRMDKRGNGPNHWRHWRGTRCKSYQLLSAIALRRARRAGQ